MSTDGTPDNVRRTSDISRDLPTWVSINIYALAANCILLETQGIGYSGHRLPALPVKQETRVQILV